MSQGRFRNQFDQAAPRTIGDRIFGGPPPRRPAVEDYADDVPVRDVDEDDGVVQGAVARPATPKGLAVRGQQPAANAIVPAADGRVALGRVTLTRVGMIIPEDLSLEEYEATRDMTINWDEASQWWHGDLLAYGERKHGESYRLVSARTGKAVKTLTNYASVARRVEMSRRRDTLSFGHHDAIASLEPEDQVAWLDYADRMGLSVPELRAALRGDVKVIRPAAMMPVEVKNHLTYLAALNGVPMDRPAKEELRARITAAREWLDALENELA